MKVTVHLVSFQSHTIDIVLYTTEVDDNVTILSPISRGTLLQLIPECVITWQQALSTGEATLFLLQGTTLHSAFVPLVRGHNSYLQKAF
jgi:hypothetical protein